MTSTRLALGLCAAFAFAAHAAPVFPRPGRRSEANVELKSPPSFAHGNQQAVYVDFQNARYELNFDIERKSSTFRSKIVFRMPKAGYPIFDVVGAIGSATLDASPVEIAEVATPGRQSKVRLVAQVTQPGTHTLEIVHTYQGQDQRYATGTVNFGIWTSDLQDRNFLEPYLPTSFEYDSYSMELEVNVSGAREEHVLLTNAALTPRGTDGWSLRAPGTFMTSALYLHLTPKSAIRTVTSSYLSASGKTIPITAYAKTSMSERTLRGFLDGSHKHLAELEGRYGAWPHEQLLVYAQSSGGGMEYNGATITSSMALGHEIAHSYFGRGFYPANGDSGWLDEALNSWRDDNYPSVADAARVSRTDMAARGDYVRHTDTRAYSTGARFIGHLHHLAEPKGGLQPFLKDFIARNLFRPVFTVDFQRSLETYLGQNLQPLFNEKVYGRAGNSSAPSEAAENPYHPRWTPTYRRGLL